MPVSIPTTGGEPEGEPPQEPGARTAKVRAFGAHIVLSPEQVVRRALFLSSIPKSALVSAAGPDGLAAMVSLCRAGFERVECARRATCAGADEAADLLLIVGPQDLAALLETATRTARLVADGALIIAQLARVGDERPLRAALAAQGFETSFSLINRSASPLAMLKVRRAAPLRKAG